MVNSEGQNGTWGASKKGNLAEQKVFQMNQIAFIPMQSLIGIQQIIYEEIAKSNLEHSYRNLSQ